ncbi:MAG TPA: DUF4276 family protein [Bryobacteraceae bacterium]|nr:DUF4276 family protein [Bryobacteraceae bacterium]
MKVIIYVEGPSDASGLRELFRDLTAAKEEQGVRISFVPAHDGEGDHQNWLLTHALKKAVNILRNDPQSRVAVAPDLTPPNRVFPHGTADELVSGVQERFQRELKNRDADPRLQERFAVFCFQFEFEVLLLAAEDALRAHLQSQDLKCAWTRPVEQQNHGRPPRDVIQELFRAHGAPYDRVLTPAQVLRIASIADLRKACPQCFAPFVDFLENA